MQAFVKLSLDEQEIFFVATPNSNKQYSFELDVAESAKDFGRLSGTYSLVCVYRGQGVRGLIVCPMCVSDLLCLSLGRV